MSELVTPDAEGLARAVRAIEAGDLIGLPTETVYGLAARAGDPDAVARIYAAKGRPADHPVIVHMAGAEAAERWSDGFDERARRLAGHLWPGPLTLVVPRRAGVGAHLSGGRDSIGLRVPDHPVALALLAELDDGLAAPSANRFGRVSPTRPSDVLDELGSQVSLVLDGGPCVVGLESTIVELVGEHATLLRPGGVPVEIIEELLGEPVERTRVGEARAPGMLAAHYAPRTRVELIEDDLAAALESHRGRRVGLMVPGLSASPPAPAGTSVQVLDAPEDDRELARVLYRRLREADEAGLEVLLVALPHDDRGWAPAVADRLRRAAAGSQTENG